MTHAERETWIELVTTIVVTLLLIVWLRAGLTDGAFDGPDALRAWARMVLRWMAWSIGVAIVIGVVARQVLPQDGSGGRIDERDRIIDLRALRAAFHVLSVGLVVVIGALAFGLTSFAAMNAVLLLALGADMVRHVLRIVAYRRGA